MDDPVQAGDVHLTVTDHERERCLPTAADDQAIIAGVRPELGSGRIKLLNAVGDLPGDPVSQNDIGVTELVDLRHIVVNQQLART